MPKPMKPSERIEEIFMDLLLETKQKTEFDKLTDIEKSIVLPTMKNQAIIAFLDEVAVESN